MSCGPPLPRHEVRIVDRAGRPARRAGRGPDRVPRALGDGGLLAEPGRDAGGASRRVDGFRRPRATGPTASCSSPGGRRTSSSRPDAISIRRRSRRSWAPSRASGRAAWPPSASTTRAWAPSAWWSSRRAARRARAAERERLRAAVLDRVVAALGDPARRGRDRGPPRRAQDLERQDPAQRDARRLPGGRAGPAGRTVARPMGPPAPGRSRRAGAAGRRPAARSRRAGYVGVTAAARRAAALAGAAAWPRPARAADRVVRGSVPHDPGGLRLRASAGGARTSRAQRRRSCWPRTTRAIWTSSCSSPRCRSRFRFVAKRELATRALVVGRIIRKVGHLTVERGEASRSVADAERVTRRPARRPLGAGLSGGHVRAGAGNPAVPARRASRRPWRPGGRSCRSRSAAPARSCPTAAGSRAPGRVTVAVGRPDRARSARLAGHGPAARPHPGRDHPPLGRAGSRPPPDPPTPTRRPR